MFWLENPRVESVNSKYFFNQLGIDQAFLTVIYKFTEPAANQHKQDEKLWIYSLSSNCHECPYQREGEISDFIHNSGSGSGTLRERTLKISTNYPLKFRLRTNGTSPLVPHDEHDEAAFCDVEPSHLGQFGVYEIQADADTDASAAQSQSDVGSLTGKCEFREIHPPVNIYYPLLLTLIFFAIFLFLSLRIYKYLTTPKLVENFCPSPRKRLDFIDIFRGICIFLMILVNGGGGGYTFLQHANWDGLNLADVIFPWFLWVMGVSIPISFQKEMGSRKQRMFGAFRRSCKLAAVGIFLNLFFMWNRAETVDLTKLRLTGVLQRSAICYFLASTLLIFGSRSGTRLGWSFVLILLALHTLLTFFLPVPGCPTGYLGPGGLHENGKYSPNCIGGSAGFIDRFILSESHMTGFSTAHAVYHPRGQGQGQGQGQVAPFDPEGILATFPSLFHVWLGVEAGFLFLHFSSTLQKKSRSKISTFASASALAVCAVGLGLFLHTSNWIPVNKKLWSLSLVLVTSGTGWILLLVLYHVVEVKRLWAGSPFREMGLNSILLFVGHLLLLEMNFFPFPFGWIFSTESMSMSRSVSTHTIRLIQTFWGLSLWILLALVCHHKRIYWVLR